MVLFYIIPKPDMDWSIFLEDHTYSSVQKLMQQAALSEAKPIFTVVINAHFNV